MVTKKQFLSGALWKIIEVLTTKGVSLVISIVLARLLSPSEYGSLEITAIFIAISDIFLAGGLNTALIREKSVDDDDYSSVLWLSLGIALIIYIILFFTAPFISSFYTDEKLINVLRTVSIGLFFQSVTVVLNSIIIRQLNFKLMFWCGGAANLLSGATGIALALCGYGVWALVVYQLLYSLSYALFQAIAIKWRPKFVFSVEKIKKLFSFGKNALLASILDFAANNITSLSIGKAYSTESLAVYNKGGMFPQQISLYTFNAVSSAMLPTFASRQDDTTELKRVMKRIVTSTAFVVFPIMFGLAAVSKRLIVFLLTEKWIDSANVLYWMCLTYAVNPFRVISTEIMYAVGDSKKNIHQEIFRLVLYMLSLFIVLSMKCNLVVLAMANSFASLVYCLVKINSLKKYFDYDIMEWLKDIFSPLVISIVMCITVYFVGYLWSNPSAIILFLQVFIGAAFYLLGSFVFKVDGVLEIIGLCKNFINKARGKANEVNH